MWLLNVDNLELKEFQGTDVPPYAILSHTWGPDEISFTEMKKSKYTHLLERKASFDKISGCCVRAKKDGLDWVWVDTCCIDKRNSAELSEAINSMFQWYKSSTICYVYLADVSGMGTPKEAIRDSRWFTRGWTLQELLAPRKLVFYAQDWSRIGVVSAYEWGRDQLNDHNLPKYHR